MTPDIFEEMSGHFQTFCVPTKVNIFNMMLGFFSSCAAATNSIFLCRPLGYFPVMFLGTKLSTFKKMQSYIFQHILGCQNRARPTFILLIELLHFSNPNPSSALMVVLILIECASQRCSATPRLFI